MSDRFSSVEIADPAFRAGARIETTVTSVALGGRRADCSFWIPALSPETARPLPLVILLHGVGGSHWAWFGKGGAEQIAASMIATGETEPFALAAPSDGLLGFGSAYVAQPGADVASWILDDVPDLAGRVDPRIDAAAPIGLIGLSMGGYGALRLALAAGKTRVPAAVGMSSLTTLADHARFGVDPLPDVADERSRSILGALDASDVAAALRIVCGRDDFLIEDNRRLHDALALRGVAHEWIEDEGDHSWEYWRRHLPGAVSFVRRHL